MSIVLKSKINSGSFGTIYKIEYNGKKNFALKVVYHRRNSINNLLEVILYFNKSNYIIRQVDYSLDIQSFAVVTPLAHCDLQQFHIRYPDYNYKKLFYHICLGVKYLHDRKIVHGDIKPSNILIFKNHNDFEAKLCDFSLSGLCLDRIYNRKAYTPVYCPPEVSETESYDFKADIWALGITFQCINGTDTDTTFHDMISGMIVHNENQRYSIYNVLNSQYFSEFGEVHYPCDTPDFSELSTLISPPSIQVTIDKLQRCRVFEEEDFIREEITHLPVLLNFFMTILTKDL